MVRHDCIKGPPILPWLDQVSEARKLPLFPQRLCYCLCGVIGSNVRHERYEWLDMPGLGSRAMERLVLEPVIDFAQIVQCRERDQPCPVLRR